MKTYATQNNPPTGLSLNRRTLRFIACGCALIVATASAATRPVVQGKANASGLIRDYQSDIVLIKGKSGGGTGFIANIRGKKFLVSNVHVLAGVRSPTFTLANRSPLRLGPAAMAVGHDLVVFEVIAGGVGIPVVDSVIAEAEMRDNVMVLGCPGKGEVVTTLEGKLIGIGPRRVEIDAKFEPGNSGSPIIHTASGKILGVASIAIRDDQLISGGSKWRRYGYRIDSVQGWQAIEWGRFYLEADALEKIEATTQELRMAITEAGSSSRYSRLAQRKYAYESPAIRNAVESYYRTLVQSGPNVGHASRGLLAALRSASSRDTFAANSRITYDYFRRCLADEIKVRESLIKDFAKSVEK